jgi:hypothetical protein
LGAEAWSRINAFTNAASRIVGKHAAARRSRRRRRGLPRARARSREAGPTNAIQAASRSYRVGRQWESEQGRQPFSRFVQTPGRRAMNNLDAATLFDRAPRNPLERFAVRASGDQSQAGTRHT